MDDQSIAELRRASARYREAVEAAIDQLEWCIGYFQRTRKREIADALGRNVRTIRQRLVH